MVALWVPTSETFEIHTTLSQLYYYAVDGGCCKKKASPFFCIRQANTSTGSCCWDHRIQAKPRYNKGLVHSYSWSLWHRESPLRRTAQLPSSSLLLSFMHSHIMCNWRRYLYYFFWYSTLVVVYSMCNKTVNDRGGLRRCLLLLS